MDCGTTRANERACTAPIWLMSRSKRSAAHRAHHRSRGSEVRHYSPGRAGPSMAGVGRLHPARTRAPSSEMARAQTIEQARPPVELAATTWRCRKSETRKLIWLKRIIDTPTTTTVEGVPRGRAENSGSGRRTSAAPQTSHRVGHAPLASARIVGIDVPSDAARCRCIACMQPRDAACGRARNAAW